mmetsp:Transcript_4089/g.4721  ORF Transcript_4089/g.4721 Transcript_4089/m.4721 type:complete len:187 (-) Transcript_4089:19-579(-)
MTLLTFAGVRNSLLYKALEHDTLDIKYYVLVDHDVQLRCNDPGGETSCWKSFHNSLIGTRVRPFVASTNWNKPRKSETLRTIFDKLCINLEFMAIGRNSLKYVFPIPARPNGLTTSRDIWETLKNCVMYDHVPSDTGGCDISMLDNRKRKGRNKVYKHRCFHYFSRFNEWRNTSINSSNFLSSKKF